MQCPLLENIKEAHLAETKPVIDTPARTGVILGYMNAHQAFPRAGHELAIRCYHRAYAPYSRFRVGAALKARGVRDPYGGCNIENASLGGTICAERSALGALISAEGLCTLEWVVVVSAPEQPVPPCGICRQVLSEFCDDTVLFYLATPTTVVDVVSFGELYPHSFRSYRVK